MTIPSMQPRARSKRWSSGARGQASETLGSRRGSGLPRHFRDRSVATAFGAPPKQAKGRLSPSSP